MVSVPASWTSPGPILHACLARLDRWSAASGPFIPRWPSPLNISFVILHPISPDLRHLVLANYLQSCIYLCSQYMWEVVFFVLPVKSSGFSWQHFKFVLRAATSSPCCSNWPCERNHLGLVKHHRKTMRVVNQKVFGFLSVRNQLQLKNTFVPGENNTKFAKMLSKPSFLWTQIPIFSCPSVVDLQTMIHTDSDKKKTQDKTYTLCTCYEEIKLEHIIKSCIHESKYTFVRLGHLTWSFYL